MSKPQFGTKYTCEACSERFYDLNRHPATCFRCGAQQSPPKPRADRLVRAVAGRGTFARRATPIVAEEKPDAGDELVVDDAEPDEDHDLGDDEEVEIEVEIDQDDEKARN